MISPKPAFFSYIRSLQVAFKVPLVIHLTDEKFVGTSLELDET